MKRIITIITVVFLVFSALGQTATKNYVKTVTARQETTTSIISSGSNSLTKQSVQYMDGLGRSIQTITRWGSGDEKDMVTPIEYDQYGRQVKSYLPYSSGLANMAFRVDPVSEQSSFYSPYGADGDYAFSETRFEDTPLNRPLEQASPGDDWKIGAATINYEYGFNDENEVILWDNSNLSTIIGNFYPGNSLYKNSVIDEDGNKTVTYTNKQGQTILKRLYLTQNKWADTYYIYDDFGNLRVVLPPESLVILNNSSAGINWNNYTLITSDYTINQTEDTDKFVYMGDITVTIPNNVTVKPGFELKAINSIITSETLDAYAFQYDYDGRGRMISKKVPGSEAVHMVYDKWDRLVLSQDGKQRENNEWLFTSYDALNRPVMTGIITDNDPNRQSQEGMQAHIMTIDNRYLAYDGSGEHGYDNQSYPFVTESGGTVKEILTVTYYDNHSFVDDEGVLTHLAGFNFELVPDFDPTVDPSNVDEFHLLPEENLQVKGQVTGMKTQMVGTEGYIESITYYDNKYRPIQMVSENHLGGTDITSNQYDFVGNLRKTQTAHSDGSTTTTIKRRFTYDHMDRLVNTFHKLDDNPEERIAHNEYNELGELITKDLHEGEQFLDYSYNIRGWLTAINDPASTDDTHLFGMKLHYNDNPLDSRKNFNGNISAMEWSNYDANGSGYSERAYSYAYDGLNRLTDARHYQDKSSGSNAFDVQVPGYDLNGNIKRLIRKGENGSNVDNLTYTYNGNQLLKVTDSNGSEGFDNGSSGYGTDYTYDANGNMISDANKGITSIEYNHLNLPTAVTLSTVEGSGRIEYLYDAAGIKLQQKVYKDGTLEKTTDYVGEFIYEDGELQLIQHEEGRIVPKNDEWDYQYHLKDHLGNVRVTFSTEPENYTMVATMENSNESESFSNYVAESETVSGEANSGTYVSKNSNLLNDGLDLNTFLQINKRDTVKVSAYAYYNDAGSSYDLAAGLIETALFGAFSSSYAAEGSTVTQTNFDNAFGNGTLLGGRSTSTTAPPAFINYIFFDREMNYITAGFEQITMSSNGSSVQVIADNFIADQDGYLLVYLSNETDQSSELIVSWDDLEIYHGKTNVVSTQDYYPFGLAFNSYRRTASSPQNYLFNGGAELNPVTNTYETLFRGYDPAIGRFMQIDPLADFLPGINPYQFAFNNPIGYNDPTGLAPKWWIRLRATVNRIGNALKGSNAAGVAVGKHKGEVFVAQTRGGSRRGTSTSRNNTSAIASTPVGNIDKPSFDPPEIDWGGRKDPPELIAQKDFPKPTPIPPRGRDVVPGSTLEFRSNLFHGGSDEFRHPQGAKRSLADAYRSLMSNKDMRVIIRASTNLTWGRHAGTPVVRNGKALNGYNLENLLNDRARAVRDALIELGVPEDQIEIGGRPLYQDLDGVTTPGFRLDFKRKE